MSGDKREFDVFVLVLDVFVHAIVNLQVNRSLALSLALSLTPYRLRSGCRMAVVVFSHTTIRGSWFCQHQRIVNYVPPLTPTGQS